jgi:hypothetical protein
MSRWYERANEASFKAVEGGYVFQNPNPWVFARPSYYLVNDAKKAGILLHLGRWRLMLLVIPAVSIAFALGPSLAPKTVGSLLLPLFLQLGPSLFSLVLFVGVFLLIAPLMALPQIYLARSLRPLLADAPRTEKRITLAEQLPKIAASVSGKVLVVGLIGASGMIVCGGLALLASYLEGDLTNSVVFTSSLLITAGVLLTLYFTYLRRLKQKLTGRG